MNAICMTKGYSLNFLIGKAHYILTLNRDFFWAVQNLGNQHIWYLKHSCKYFQFLFNSPYTDHITSKDMFGVHKIPLSISSLSALKQNCSTELSVQGIPVVWKELPAGDRHRGRWLVIKSQNDVSGYCHCFKFVFYCAGCIESIMN